MQFKSLQFYWGKRSHLTGIL